MEKVTQTLEYYSFQGRDYYITATFSYYKSVYAIDPTEGKDWEFVGSEIDFIDVYNEDTDNWDTVENEDLIKQIQEELELNFEPNN